MKRIAQQSGEFRLSPEECRLYVRDRAIDLTRTEFSLLFWFFLHPGMLATREMLLEEIWHLKGANSRCVDVTLSRLRLKLEACNFPIRTVHGKGYFLDVGSTSEQKHPHDLQKKICFRP